MADLMTMVTAFIAGGFPTGVMISRWVHRRDVRQFGSGNTGAVNVWRVFGLGWGLIVVTVDVGKGWMAVGLIPRWFNDEPSMEMAALCGLLAVTGHIWSPFTRFRGGKGVGAAFGGVLALYPLTAVICLGIWIVMLILTRYASLAALVTLFCYPAMLYWMQDITSGVTVVAVTLSILILFAHRSNLRRLWRSEELKVGHHQYGNVVDK